MNFLKKKLKPLTSGSITTANLNQFGAGSGAQAKKGQSGKHNNSNRDLEDDLYDEYVIEAPPHPSELLALGVDSSEIDANDPEKLRELYKKAIEEGKDKKTNSVLLARQRQKEELEEKKRTREEWKFFDSLASRVEEVVKNSQKNLDHWKESSTINQLTEPDYELRETADQVFKSVTTIKQEKGENDWIDFDEESSKKKVKEKQAQEEGGASSEQDNGKTEFDEFGCPIGERRVSSVSGKDGNSFVVEELLQDFGIDLRTEEQKRAIELKKKKKEQELAEEEERKKRALEAEQEKLSSTSQQESKKVDLKAAARPRPRPRPQGAAGDEPKQQQQQPQEEVDPFDTSFVTGPSVVSEELKTREADLWLGEDSDLAKEDTSKNSAAIEQKTTPATTYVDPFDTSYVNI